MKIDFDQIRHGGSRLPSTDIASHAEAIIASNRAVRVASELAPNSNNKSDEGKYTNSVVAEYGKALKGPLAWIIRHSVVFDANTLPFDKATIHAALLECATEPSFNSEDLASIGDLLYYLSYFRSDWNGTDDENADSQIADQHEEGAFLRSQWLDATAHRRRSKMSQFFSSWLKPNA